jgi:hypothetical protein
LGPWEWKWNFWDRERDPVKYWLCRIVVWIINIFLALGLMGCINWVLGNGNGTSGIEKETLLNTGYVGLWFGL